MAALGHISKFRHVVVGASVAGTAALAAIGVIGDGDHEERFDTWQTVIEPAGGDALRITETFDHDFGDESRHGPERVIPNDFGAPTDVVASSPDAPADVTVMNDGAETVIRIGDPDVTVSGQHRYVVAYTLPDAQLSRGFLAVDAIAGDRFETDIAQVAVTGFELDDPHCFVGEAGSTDECDLVEQDGVYSATIEPLPPYNGITVDGTIVDVVEPSVVDPLPMPDRRSDRRLPVTIAVALLGVLSSVGVYLWARRRGRNEVFAGGAADAAYGELTPPGTATAAAQRATSLVPDDRMDDLATIEFVPPKGVTPWEGAVLLDEHLGDGTVQAWLSGLAGRGAIVLDERNGKLTIGSGPTRNQLDPVDRSLLDRVFNGQDPYVTGSYDPVFARAWTKIGEMQRERIAASGWWKQLPPGSGLARGGGGGARAASGLIAMAVFVLIFAGSMVTALLGMFSSWPAALLLGLLLPAIVAYFMYRVLLPARSAQGSALALRTESFRRFLHASEAQHVEWAWEHDVLREYSGWAVALGEADAWSAALERANVPEPARATAMPTLLIAHSASSLSASRVQPSSSGSGGSSSGGFSGGSVGGGGGGGSRGSW